MSGRMVSIAIGVFAAILATLVPVRVHAQVRIDIGIQLPASPPFVVIPGMPVYYAPSTPANVFFYGHQYWAFQGGGWYVGSSWNGPWAIVETLRRPRPAFSWSISYFTI